MPTTPTLASHSGGSCQIPSCRRPRSGGSWDPRRGAGGAPPAGSTRSHVRAWPRLLPRHRGALGHAQAPRALWRAPGADPCPARGSYPEMPPMPPMLVSNATNATAEHRSSTAPRRRTLTAPAPSAPPPATRQHLRPQSIRREPPAPPRRHRSHRSLRRARAQPPTRPRSPSPRRGQRPGGLPVGSAVPGRVPRPPPAPLAVPGLEVPVVPNYGNERPRSPAAPPRPAPHCAPRPARGGAGVPYPCSAPARPRRPG